MRPTATFKHFNDSQRHALDGNRNLAVRAGAGSGKTSVLIERIVQLLARSWDLGAPLGLPSILALTFTRKAAAEMQSRLRGAFERMAEQAPAEAEAPFWRRCLEDLPRTTIGTIDGFCARVLREFGYLDDEGTPPIDPDFEPLADYDEAALKQEAIERVLDRLSDLPARERSPRVVAQAEASLWWGEEEGYATLIRHLTALLNHIVDPQAIVRAHESAKPAAERTAAIWANVPAVARFWEDREGLKGAVEQLIQAIAELPRPSTSLQTLRGQLVELVALIDQTNEQGEGAVLLRMKEALLTGGGDARVQGLGAVAEWLKPLQETWQPLLVDFEAEYDGELRSLEAADRLVRLLQPVQDEYLRLCHERKQYDFLTLARRTRTLLHRSDRVRRELKDRYRYVLVDEFQDTNRLQWDIIAPLVNKDDGNGLEADRLFIVGDPQQSIYRFRHADVSVFHHVQEAIEASNRAHGRESVPTEYDKDLGQQTSSPEQRCGLMPLGANYRTLAPLPLRLVDRVFRHVFDPSVHGLDPNAYPFEVRYQPLEAGLLPSDPAGEICYLMPPEPEEEENDESELAAEDLGPVQVRALVDRLQALAGQPRRRPGANEPPLLSWADMAVLLPSRAVILSELEKEFRRRDIPYVVTKGIGFWQRQEVRDLVNLATYLADDANELALFAVLRGPLGQRTDSEIFFLSQLGRASIRRGLAFLESLPPEHADSSPLAPLPSDSAQRQEHWRRLPARAQAALAQYWQQLPPESRQGLCSLAQRLQLWRQRVDRMTHAELLQSALAESGAYAIYACEEDGELMIANLRRLIDFIRDWETTDAVDLARLARRLRTLVEDAQREEQAPLAKTPDAVQIMTVHAAKGLEFPVVAIPKMERQAVRPARPRLQVIGPWDALLPEDAAQFSDLAGATMAISVRHPRRPREQYKPRLLRALERLDAAQEVAESRRLFYVAATRAKEHLILAGKQPSKNKDGTPRRQRESWQKWFEDALRLTEADQQRGFWEDPAGGLRVVIFSEPPGVPAAIERPPYVPTVSFALQSIRPEAPRAISVEQLLELRTRDLFPAWPTAMEFLNGNASSDRFLARRLLGALVRRGVSNGLVNKAIAAQEAVLLATANHWLRAQRGHDEASSQMLGNRDLLDSLVREARRLLGELPTPRGLRLHKLLAADGDEDVPFQLRIGAFVIHGSFDKVLTGPGGANLLDCSAGTTDPSQDAEYAFRLKVQASAFAESRWAAIDRAVTLVAVSLRTLTVRTVTYQREKLAAFNNSLRADLEAMWREVD